MSATTPLIRRLNDGADAFSKNQRVLARYVLANYQSVAFATVAQLATQSGVSEATVVRFAKALSMLRAAPEVVVVGTRSTAPLANHLWFALTKIAVDATLVTTISSETYDYLSRVDKRACVVVIGFPRYLREQVRVLEFARNRRLATLTVTDSTFSPLRGHVSLYAPAESASFVAFHCAPLVLLNALVHELSVADEKKTLAALDRFESVAESQEYFLKE